MFDIESYLLGTLSGEGGGGGGAGVTILSGTGTPAPASGNNGNIYLRYGISDAYAPVEFLEVTTAGPYINTGVTNRDTAYFEVVAQYIETPGNNYGIFGAQTAVEYTINTWSGSTFIHVGGTGANVPSGEQTDKHTFIANADGVSIDGTITGTATWSSATGINYYLFAINYSGGILTTANTRIYSCKLYDGSTLIREFAPCIRISDNEPGMYDLVNGVFYDNDGTGSFIAGPAGSWPHSSSIVNRAYAKVNGTWQNLIGTDIADIDLGDTGA